MGKGTRIQACVSSLEVHSRSDFYINKLSLNLFLKLVKFSDLAQRSYYLAVSAYDV